MPYNRYGAGPRILVAFQGLLFENAPLTGMLDQLTRQGLRPLFPGYTVYVVTRRPNLPEGYSLRDMADDYAVAIREEFRAPVDVMGISTGGPIALHFAADHPELVRRLVLAYTAYRLGAWGRAFQWRMGEQAAEGHRHRRAFYAGAAEAFVPEGRVARLLGTALFWLLGPHLFGTSPDLSDLVVTVKAEDAQNLDRRLVEVQAPTLVIGVEKDPFYPAQLQRETALGIPQARLALLPGGGHGSFGKRFCQEVLAFLGEGPRDRR